MPSSCTQIPFLLLIQFDASDEAEAFKIICLVSDVSNIDAPLKVIDNGHNEVKRLLHSVNGDQVGCWVFCLLLMSSSRS